MFVKISAMAVTAVTTGIPKNNGPSSDTSVVGLDENFCGNISAKATSCEGFSGN